MYPRPEFHSFNNPTRESLPNLPPAVYEIVTRARHDKKALLMVDKQQFEDMKKHGVLCPRKVLYKLEYKESGPINLFVLIPKNGNRNMKNQFFEHALVAMTPECAKDYDKFGNLKTETYMDSDEDTVEEVVNKMGAATNGAPMKKKEKTKNKYLFILLPLLVIAVAYAIFFFELANFQ